MLVLDRMGTADMSLLAALRSSGHEVEVVTTLAHAVCQLAQAPTRLVLVHGVEGLSHSDVHLLSRAPGAARCVVVSKPGAHVEVPGVKVLALGTALGDLLSIAKSVSRERARAQPTRARRRKTQSIIPRVLDRPVGWRVRGEFEADSRPCPEPKTAPRYVPSTPSAQTVGRSRETLAYIPAVPG